MAARKKKKTRAKNLAEIQKRNREKAADRVKKARKAAAPKTSAKKSILVRATAAAAAKAAKAKLKPAGPEVEHFTEVVQTVGKLRHWKQRFDATAAFVWRRRITWAADGRIAEFEIGTLVPDWVLKSMGRTKLSRFWESRVIELAELKSKSETKPEPVVRKKKTRRRRAAAEDAAPAPPEPGPEGSPEPSSEEEQA